jgi:glyoxylate reductase
MVSNVFLGATGQGGAPAGGPADRANFAGNVGVAAGFDPPHVAWTELARRCILHDAKATDGAYDALLVGLPLRIDEAFLSRLRGSVRAIATYSVGLDHIDLEAVRARNLVLFNTPAVLSNAVADHAMLLILAAARRMTEATVLLREGRWTDMRLNQILGIELAGRTLGIYGLGDIGARVAQRAAAFGMRVVYHNRRRAGNEAGALFIASLDSFLHQTDILLLAAPSTDQTRNFLDSRHLEMMRDGVIIVNIARGDLVDDDALVAALASGKVRSAALDVFRNEPHIDERYRELSSVVATPHVGSATEEARRGMAATLCDAISAWRRGERPANQIV